MAHENFTHLFQDWFQPDISCLSDLVWNPHPAVSSWLLANKEFVLGKLSDKQPHLWNILSSKPAAISFLLQHPEYVNNLGILSNSNPWAMYWIQPILDQLADPSFDFRANRETVLYVLSDNRNPFVFEKLIKYVPFEHCYWWAISANPGAIDFLLQHPEYIVWSSFPGNPHPRAIQHMAQHPEKMDNEPYSYITVMTRNECPDAGVYLKSIGRDDLYKEWAYRYGSLEEMDLEHLSNTALEKMAQNPQAISYFKERPELIQTYTSYLLRNSAIFKGT